MLSPLLTAFVLNLVIHVLNAIGAPVINEVLWVFYNRFPTPTSKAAHDQNKLKREVVRLKRELNAVSAQDDFARWAKLRRQHDKATADFDKISASLQSSRASFDQAATVLRFLSTNGLRFFLEFWYQRTPLFWLPQGWVPHYVEWLLCFPKAPIGSVSVQIWNIACRSVIALMGEAVAAVFVLASKKPQGEAKEKAQAFSASGGRGAGKVSSSEKKEL